MVETKCIHVDKAQAAVIRGEHAKLADDHWQALIALHRTLLHEHHDFFLASQHPSASPALRRLPAKYSMPARMWKHGIHSFLERLRHRLPDSLEYMLAFICLAYQMMGLLFETVPSFEDTWIECLGDLARYRMAIEDEDLRDREIWAGVARTWYSKAADRNPLVGRLSHHLAILARPNATQQLYFYSRSLTSVYPFMSARESIMTLFDPFLGRIPMSNTYSHVDTHFIGFHASLFVHEHPEKINKHLGSFLSELNGHVERLSVKAKEPLAHIAVANIAALYGYGIQDHPLRRLFDYHMKYSQVYAHTKILPKDESMIVDSGGTNSVAELAGILQTSTSPELEADFDHACSITFQTLTIVCRRASDANCLLHVNLLLLFLLSLATIDREHANQYANLPVQSYVESIFEMVPWKEVIFFMNTLVNSVNGDWSFEQTSFTAPEHGGSGPLSEDYFARGQVWSQASFPETWFADDRNDEERAVEHASTVNIREKRALWLLVRLAEVRFRSHTPSRKN